MSYKQMRKKLIHPWEKPMRVINVIVFIIAVLVSVIVALEGLTDGVAADKLLDSENIAYAGVFSIIVLLLFQLGRQYGKTLSVSVEINENQFPEVYSLVKEYSEKLEMGYVPRVFLAQEGGVLNAFSTSFFRKRYLSINSDILDIAYLEHKDMSAVAFVIAHELGHLKRHHATTLMIVLESIAAMIPIWGAAQSRVKEYTCDRHAAWLVPEGKEGIILLAAGKHIYKNVDMKAYLDTSKEYRGLFFFIQNLLADHPTAPKRMRALFIEGDKGKVF